MLCQECPKKPQCKEACQELNEDLKKHERYQRETTISSDEILSFLANDPDVFPYKYGEMVRFFLPGQPLNFKFLTPLQNKILHLFYFDGRTYKQIATNLSGGSGKTKRQLNANVIRRQIYLAKQKIRNFFYNSREEKINESKRNS